MRLCRNVFAVSLLLGAGASALYLSGTSGPRTSLAGDGKKALSVKQTLEPGTYYLVRVSKQTTLFLPKGMDLVKWGPQQGLFHNGKRGDMPEMDCGGPVKQWLNDHGDVGFECLECWKKWAPRRSRKNK